MNNQSDFSILFKEGTSSFINGLSYAVGDQTLILNFKNDVSYKYYDVPKDIFEEMIVAESKGKYFHQTIKNKFKNEAVK